MISSEAWGFLLQGAIALGVSLIGIGIKGIYSQLREMNGSVRELMTWKDDHIKTDDGYHARTDKAIDKLWEKMDQK